MDLERGSKFFVFKGQLGLLGGPGLLCELVCIPVLGIDIVLYFVCPWPLKAKWKYPTCSFKTYLVPHFNNPLNIFFNPYSPSDSLLCPVKSSVIPCTNNLGPVFGEETFLRSLIDSTILGATSL